MSLVNGCVLRSLKTSSTANKTEFTVSKWRHHELHFSHLLSIPVRKMLKTSKKTTARSLPGRSASYVPIASTCNCVVLYKWHCYRTCSLRHTGAREWGQSRLKGEHYGRAGPAAVSSAKAKHQEPSFSSIVTTTKLAEVKSALKTDCCRFIAGLTSGEAIKCESTV